MAVKKLSRGPELDMDLCTENAGGNRFNLVIMAAARARDLSRYNKIRGNKEHSQSTVSALLEFQNGELDIDYLKRIK
jgi:DNA-directed RNA polymerase subunit K/omega